MILLTSESVKNLGFFFGLRGSFGFGSIASTYFCARAAFQIRLTTPHMLRIVFGSSPPNIDAR